MEMMLYGVDVQIGVDVDFDVDVVVGVDVDVGFVVVVVGVAFADSLKIITKEKWMRHHRKTYILHYQVEEYILYIILTQQTVNTSYLTISS